MQTVREIKLYDKGSREEEAEVSLKYTVVTRRVAWVLVAMFLVTILLEPILQHVSEIRTGLAARRAAATKGESGTPARILPQVYDVVDLLPSWQSIRQAHTCREAWMLLPPVKKINAFENALKENSESARFLLPRAQTALCRIGCGNEKAYCGRDGWLFYRPEIDYLTEDGFLTPDRLKARSRSGAEAIQPDPRKAILQFQEQLKKRGIQLVVMPVPSKAMVAPGDFTQRYGADHAILQNPSFDKFTAELEAAGIPVFDINRALHDSGKGLTYLATDTHWRPETMEAAAQLLRDFITKRSLLPAAPAAGYKQVVDVVTNLGDIAVMLRLPEEQKLYTRQTVTIHPVLNSRGEFWQADRKSDVLLLGDSYSNIYSLDAMGWGYGAGFAEQIGFAMQRPVDRIVRNDAGAFATRQLLARELAQGRDRLEGKKLVVWEFAVRELTSGDWKMIDLKTPEEIAALKAQATHDSSFFVAPAGKTVRVSGIVDSLSFVPRPGSVPYKDHIFTIHLTNLQGIGTPVEGTQAVVFMWDMRDSKLTPAAKHREGDKLVLNLHAWADVSGKYGGINQSLPDNDDLMSQEPNWGEEGEL